MIIVGYTGSTDAVPALEAAARLAARSGEPLLIVSAFDNPTVDVATYVSFTRPTQAEVEEWYRDVMIEGEQRARAQGAVEVESKVVLGPVPAALIVSATAEDVIVVGHRHHREFASAFLGSVAVQLSGHAPCPVVVVGPEPHEWAGPLVVGVDGSTASRHAVTTAAEWARRFALPLVVASAWQDQVLVGLGEGWALSTLQTGADAVRDATREMIDGIAEEIREQHPDLDVSTRLLHGDPAVALLEATRDATALIVGSRGRGGFSGLLLGSVSHQLIHRSEIPVVVVR